MAPGVPAGEATGDAASGATGDAAATTGDAIGEPTAAGDAPGEATGEALVGELTDGAGGSVVACAGAAAFVGALGAAVGVFFLLPPQLTKSKAQSANAAKSDTRVVFGLPPRPAVITVSIPPMALSPTRDTATREPPGHVNTRTISQPADLRQ